MLFITNTFFFVQASPILGAAWRKHLFFNYVVILIHISGRILATAISLRENLDNNDSYGHI